MRTWKLVSQQYRAWLDCMDMQADLAVYWWQRPITFGVSRFRLNEKIMLNSTLEPALVPGVETEITTQAGHQNHNPCVQKYQEIHHSHIST